MSPVNDDLSYSRHKTLTVPSIDDVGKLPDNTPEGKVIYARNEEKFYQHESGSWVEMSTGGAIQTYEDTTEFPQNPSDGDKIKWENDYNQEAILEYKTYNDIQDGWVFRSTFNEKFIFEDWSSGQIEPTRWSVFETIQGDPDILVEDGYLKMITKNNSSRQLAQYKSNLKFPPICELECVEGHEIVQGDDTSYNFRMEFVIESFTDTILSNDSVPRAWMRWIDYKIEAQIWRQEDIRHKITYGFNGGVGQSDSPGGYEIKQSIILTDNIIYNNENKEQVSFVGASMYNDGEYMDDSGPDPNEQLYLDAPIDNRNSSGQIRIALDSASESDVSYIQELRFGNMTVKI